jgi:type II secretory pathway pseudopilin PulG
MLSTRSIRQSNVERGFSLLELLLGTAVMMIVLATAGGFFVVNRNTLQDQIVRIETVQGLRAAMDSMVRDLRLGGACLPTTGDFVALDAANSTTDTIVTRTGLVQANETCIRTVLTSDLTASAAQLSVQSAAGFAPGMRVYIRNSNGTTGEIFSITGVDSSTHTLQKATDLTCPQVGGCPSPAYPSGSGVYAIDERQYAVDTSNPALPVLTLTVNGNPPSAFVAGIENLQFQYELARNCSSPTGCDVVDVPANESEFALVNQIYITMTARSSKTLSNGQYYRLSRTVSAKPRNLLPG